MTRLLLPGLLLMLALGCGSSEDPAGGAGGSSAGGSAGGGGSGGASGGAGGTAGAAAGGGGAAGAGGAIGGAGGNAGAAGGVFPGADWETRTPADVGVDGAKLDAALAYYGSKSGSQGTDQALVVKDGYLIWAGSDIDNVHNVWSVSKSFTSTVLGLLIDDGKASAQTLAKDHLPALGASYGSVTLAHFASMTSGYDGGGDQSSTPFSPTAPLFPPGSEFQYWDSAMNQFANVLTRINGARVDALFAQRVADPIGMDSGDWSWGDFGSVDGIVVNGGAGNKSKGIQISARQLARFGWLFLNRGRWQTAQLISQSWVDAASGVQVAASTPAHTNGSTGPGVYGYNWWVNGTLPGGMRRWPDAPADTFAALGYNHNRLYVVPGWNALVVRLGTDGTQPSDAETSEFFKLLADAGLGS